MHDQLAIVFVIKKRSRHTIVWRAAQEAGAPHREYICSIPYAYFVPYAYGMYHTRTVRFSVPYAYGIDIRVWYVSYAYYAFSQYLLALPSPSYNGLSLQVFLAEQT